MTSDPSVLVDRYELGAALGRGGMADVVRARDRLLDRAVAVKLLREGSAIDRERFASEARLLAMLSHPNVVTVLDAGVDHDRPWLVLELVDGAPMDEWLVGGPVEAARIATIGAQVAEALAHAHAHEIVHRDVKPANVLIASDDRAKLSDFGIARRANSASLTLTGHTIGTVTYLAPEQVAGESVSTPADVYALGLVLLEALTGRREYDGPPVEAAFARLHRSPTVPASLPTGWPSLISTMTTRDPAERPTAAAVADRLTVLAGRAPATSVASPPSTAEVPSVSVPATRRRRGGPVIASVVFAGLLLTTAIVLTAVDDDHVAASTSDSTAPRAASKATPRATAHSPSATIATTVEPVVVPTPAASQTPRHRVGEPKQHPARPKAKKHKAKGPKPKKHRPPGGRPKPGKKP